MGGFSRVGWAALIGAALAALLFVAVWFQPQQLFIDVQVDEALPTAHPSAQPEDDSGDAAERAEVAEVTESPPTPRPSTPQVVVTGTFQSRSHPTTGVASVVELPDGGRILRLEGFATDNGPDLFVYLSAAAPDAPADAFDDVFIDLGRLKGNLGDQNYDIPEGVDLTQYRSAVIWCRRFTVVFGAASLDPPPS